MGIASKKKSLNWRIDEFVKKKIEHQHFVLRRANFETLRCQIVLFSGRLSSEIDEKCCVSAGN